MDSGGVRVGARLCVHGRRTHLFGTARTASPMLHQCYATAAHDVIRNPGLTYVEGYINAHIPIAHAWTVDSRGVVRDRTIRPHDGIAGYFGVPFSRDFLRECLLTNKVYGLLDGFAAAKTFVPLLRGERRDVFSVPKGISA